jgi:hypothetical protein
MCRIGLIHRTLGRPTTDRSGSSSFQRRERIILILVSGTIPAVLRIGLLPVRAATSRMLNWFLILRESGRISPPPGVHRTVFSSLAILAWWYSRHRLLQAMCRTGFLCSAKAGSNLLLPALGHGWNYSNLRFDALI